MPSSPEIEEWTLTVSHMNVGEMLAMLIGSAEQILARRERIGHAYFTAQESALEAFAPVISLLTEGVRDAAQAPTGSRPAILR